MMEGSSSSGFSGGEGSSDMSGTGAGSSSWVMSSDAFPSTSWVGRKAGSSAGSASKIMAEHAGAVVPGMRWTKACGGRPLAVGGYRLATSTLRYRADCQLTRILLVVRVVTMHVTSPSNMIASAGSMRTTEPVCCFRLQSAER